MKLKYTRALAARKHALAECRAARGDLRSAVGGVIGVYQAHPTPVLASAAGIGFVLAQFRIGSSVVRAGMHAASGPVWRLVRQYLPI